MRLLEKFASMEEAAIALQGRCSPNREAYCLARYKKSSSLRGRLFWLNMHYLHLLMVEWKRKVPPMSEEE